MCSALASHLINQVTKDSRITVIIILSIRIMTLISCNSCTYLSTLSHATLSVVQTCWEKTNAFEGILYFLPSYQSGDDYNVETGILLNPNLHLIFWSSFHKVYQVEN